MAEIHFLGTGGSMATPQRDNTSVLLRTGNALILIDCPGSVTAKIRKLGFEPGQVTTVILTHIHPDHIYGLTSLVHSQMCFAGEILVMGSEASVDFSRRLLDLFGLRRRKIRTRLRFRVLDAIGAASSLFSGLPFLSGRGESGDPLFGRCAGP
jgi:ribonuclease Z